MNNGPRQSRRWGDGGTAWRWLAAILGGVLLAGSFPPIGLGFLAPIAVGAITLATVTTTRLRGAYGLGFVAGFVFFGILLRWMSVLGTDAWLALALFCALWIGLVGLLTRIVARLPYWPAWVAAVWVTQEALRDRIPWGGFPWGRLAFSQSDSPTLGLASIGGAPLISAVVAFSGALLAWATLKFLRRRSSPIADPEVATPVNKAVAVAVLAAIGVWMVGLAIPRPTGGETADGPSSAVVALVQGSVPNFGLDAMAQRRAVLNNHVNGTRELAAKVRSGEVQTPELVIWPENSTDIDPFTDQSAAAAISSAADDIGVPILVGAVTRNPNDPNTLWNVGIVWEPETGPSDLYVKQHPVPFGEYLPGRSILARFITRFERIPYDFAPGPEPGVLQVGSARIADVICFEIAYDEVVRDGVRAGGRAIAVQTNNATYSFAGLGGSAQPEQQAAMSAIRAVEHGRSVLIAATSGVTAIIAPDGTVTAQAPLLAPSQIVGEVPLRDSQTIATRIGAIPEWIILAATLLAVLFCVITSRRDRAAATKRIADESLNDEQQIE